MKQYDQLSGCCALYFSRILSTSDFELLWFHPSCIISLHVISLWLVLFLILFAKQKHYFWNFVNDWSCQLPFFYKLEDTIESMVHLHHPPESSNLQTHQRSWKSIISFRAKFRFVNLTRICIWIMKLINLLWGHTCQTYSKYVFGATLLKYNLQRWKYNLLNLTLRTAEIQEAAWVQLQQNWQ